MIRTFNDDATRDIFEGINSKQSRKKLDLPLYHVARRKLDMLDSARDIKDLKAPPSNHLEQLKGKLQGYYSIRINDQFRIIFCWGPQGAEDVEIIDYH